VERAGLRLRQHRPLAALTARLLAAGACLALLACTATISAQPAASPDVTSPGPVSSADSGGGLASLPAACHAQGSGGVLPDPACTPGGADPAVTQANLHTTICVSGYTTKVRPPVSYTDAIKRDLLRRYGLGGTMADYELDHLVPLEVGGAPASVRNLWPEARGPHPGSTEKDHLENLLHTRVCNGQLQLADAQRMFEQNWVQSWQQLGSA
jgi:hypothetical protein